MNVPLVVAPNVTLVIAPSFAAGVVVGVLGSLYVVHITSDEEQKRRIREMFTR